MHAYIEMAWHSKTFACNLCRSESTHTALVCLAASTLYDDGPEPAVQAIGSSLQMEDAGEIGRRVASDDEDAASFRTATGNSDEAAAQDNQVPCCAELSCMISASFLPSTSLQ